MPQETFAQVLSSINNSELRIALEKLLPLIAELTSINTIQFNTSYLNGNAEGRLQWNIDDGTLEFGLPGGSVNQQIGQELIFRARNSTGTDIPNGTPVFILGAQANRPKIIPADASSITTSGSVGVATELIAASSFGYCTTAGLVREVDTSGLTEGALLWLSETAGEYTTTKPTAPARSTAMGYCINQHATEGIVLIHPIVVPGLLSLSDVLPAAPSNGDTLRWSTANGRFELGP